MGGSMRLSGAEVYAYAETDGNGVRVRVSLDDWERLGLSPGQQVRVEIPGREAGSLLLAGADEHPPFVWLTLRPLSTRKAS